MSDWPKVRWTQARQVTRLMGMTDEESPAEAIAPAAFFAGLRAEGRDDDALAFLGHALPRYEGVAWAADAIRAMPRPPGPSADALALAAAARWVEDPDDGRRRTAYDAAEAAGEASAERILGLAIYMSGGSIAPADQAAVNPAPELSGRLAAAAILVAAQRAPDAAAEIAGALDAGEAIARGGR